MSNALDVQDSTFESEVVQSGTPVLVDFWAPWCGPCKAMGPAIDQLGAEFGERLKVVKHNTDDHPDVPAQLGITGLPTFLVFKNGEVVGRHTGMMPYEKLKGLVEPHL